MGTTKNCYQCKQLEWVDDGGNEDGSNSGYTCNKRNYRSDSEEDNHLGQLEKETYLKKGKSCCDNKKFKDRNCPECGKKMATHCMYESKHVQHPGYSCECGYETGLK